MEYPYYERKIDLNKKIIALFLVLGVFVIPVICFFIVNK